MVSSEAAASGSSNDQQAFDPPSAPLHCSLTLYIVLTSIIEYVLPDCTFSHHVATRHKLEFLCFDLFSYILK
jgi:hypothetical protein